MKRGSKQLLVVGDRVLVRPEKSEGKTKVGAAARGLPNRMARR